MDELEDRQENLPTLKEPTPLSAVRNAAVFAKLPVHQLSKAGKKIDIRIIERDAANGQIVKRWQVTPNEEFGMPGQLAYKIDTIVINRRVSDAGTALPRIIRLGTLREIARELGIAEGDTNTIKHALQQNASAFIRCKVNYTTNDDPPKEKWVEADFTRYQLIFRGQTVENKKVESVYLVLNDPYYGALQTARPRPLDHNYLKQLTPSSQRFYEILSFEMFAALKYKNVRLKLRYSWYCQVAPQARFFERKKVQTQMNKLHRSHLASGYIKRPIEYEDITDPEGKPDWLIYYRPGPRAEQEYEYFHHKRRTLPPAAEVDEKLLQKLMGQGIGERVARRLIVEHPGLDFIGLVEYAADQHQKNPKDNPTGFLIHLIRTNTQVPDWFETSAHKAEKRAAYDRANQEQLAALERQQAEEQAYHHRVEEYWASLSPDDQLQRVTAALTALARDEKLHFAEITPELRDKMALRAAKKTYYKERELQEQRSSNESDSFLNQ